MQRTIRLRAQPTTEQATILAETMRQHAACFNAVASYAWQQREKNGVRLHHATYYSLRAQFPHLPSQLVIAARTRATEAVKSALGRLKAKRKVSRPTSTRPPIRYDARTYSLKGDVVSLSTAAGRQRIPVGLNAHARSILAQATSFDSADLLYRKRKYWLHVVVTLPDVPFIPNGQVVGIDLGLNRPAVASNNRFFGERRWREIDRRCFRLKRKLQSKGTRSAKRHLKRLSGRANRFRRDCDHVLSRQIVNSVEPGSTIVVENLKDIRTRVRQRGRESRRRLHSWSFAQLRTFLAYKAEGAGCAVVGVDPRHTSQACSRCGYVHRSNRRSQSVFCCRRCGFELNADLNASRNITLKHLANSGISAAGGLLSTGLSFRLSLQSLALAGTSPRL